MGTAGQAVDRPGKASQIVLNNSVTLLIRQAVLWGMNGILILFLPRYLGDQGLGQLQFAISFTAIFAIGMSLGASQFVIKEVARNRLMAAHYLGTALAVRMLASLMVLAVIFGAVQLTGYSTTAKLVIYVAAITMVVTSFARLTTAFLHGMENMGAPAMAEVAGKALVVVVGIAVLVSGYGVVAYAAVLLAGALTHFVLTGGFVARDVGLRTNVRLPTAKALLIGGVPFILMGVLLEVYNHVDVIIVRIIAGEAVTGWYAAATQLYKTVELFPLALTTAMLPTLARVHRTDVRALVSISRKSIVIVTLVTVPLGLGLSLMSAEVLSFLPYPDAFRNSIPLLTILALTIPATALLMLLGAISIAVDRQNVWAVALAVTLALDVIFNLLTVPYFDRVYGNGAIGAALTTLGAELFMVAVGVWLMPAGVFDRATRSTLIKIVAAGLLMVAAGMLALDRGIPAFAVIPLCAVVYFAIVFGSRAVTAAEVASIREMVRRRFRGAGETADAPEGVPGG